MSAQQHTIKARIVRFCAKPSLLIAIIPWKKARADEHVVIVYKLWTGQLLYSPASQETLNHIPIVNPYGRVKKQNRAADSHDHRSAFTSSQCSLALTQVEAGRSGSSSPRLRVFETSQAYMRCEGVSREGKEGGRKVT